MRSEKNLMYLLSWSRNASFGVVAHTYNLSVRENEARRQSSFKPSSAISNDSNTKQANTNVSIYPYLTFQVKNSPIHLPTQLYLDTAHPQIKNYKKWWDLAHSSKLDIQYNLNC